MDTFSSLMMGFSVALTPTNLLFAFAGSLFGTIVGILPGLDPAAGTALLIPLTFHLDPTGAIIMLVAIYYGSQYGGTITSVLMNVPGEAASAITCLDGYQMAKQGRAGAALSIAAIGSFIGGTLATLGLVVAAQPLTKVALRFGPVEFFALTVLGIVLVMGLAGKSMVKALIMAVFGLLIGIVATNPPAAPAAEVQLRAAGAALGRAIEVRQSLAEGAFAIGNAGDAATHDRMVVEAAERIANQVDVLCLAQVSMAQARAAVEVKVKVPVLTSPATAVARLKALLAG